MNTLFNKVFGENEKRVFYFYLKTEGTFPQYFWEFPGSPVVRTRHFHCLGWSSVPGQGTKIPQAIQHSQKKKKERNLFSS